MIIIVATSEIHDLGEWATLMSSIKRKSLYNITRERSSTSPSQFDVPYT